MVFKHPFTCSVSGPIQSGKTHFTVQVLKNIAKRIKRRLTGVVWCHGQSRKGLGLPDFVEVEEGLDVVDTIDGSEPTLLILDDLMQEASEAKSISNLFTKGSHHKDLSIIMLVQNMFHQGQFMRTIHLNPHYMVLFKNPGDACQVCCLSDQLFPGNIKFLASAYKQATSRPHGYLVLDFTQEAPDDLRVLSDILPGEEGYYYVSE